MKSKTAEVVEPGDTVVYEGKVLVAVRRGGGICDGCYGCDGQDYEFVCHAISMGKRCNDTIFVEKK